jgi:hypothetical protein
MRNVYFEVYFLIILSVSILQCQSPTNQEEVDLSLKFYKLNKDQSFDFFRNIILESRDIDFDVCDNKFHVNYSFASFYDSISKEYIKIPFSFEGKVKDTSVRCNYECREYLMENYYQEEFDIDIALKSINKEVAHALSQIHLPEAYKYDNVLKITGKPFIGTLEFKLTDTEAVLYNWGNKDIESKNADQLGNNWYRLTMKQ